jgi:hypothetical protein
MLAHQQTLLAAHATETARMSRASLFGVRVPTGGGVDGRRARNSFRRYIHADGCDERQGLCPEVRGGSSGRSNISGPSPKQNPA